jgi:hypothetical protein
MKTIKISVLYITVLAITFISCSSDDDGNPIPVNEEEVITTLIATLTPSTGPTITLTSRDLDGDGPDAPVITISSSLAVNTTYAGSLDLLNETEDPAESINEEIEEEDDEHQFFFSSSVVSTSYSDLDGDGNPVGLLFALTTNDAGTGSLVITLRHEPSKSAEGVSEGDITNAGGETDLSVTFPINVE